MPSETGEQIRQLAKTQQPGGASEAAATAGAAEQEHLPCPRCDSTNTKFCYYNNYNFSQPRHFCKSCRRYWTHGGTLRDIPVGGGSRKNAKRSRTSSVYSSAGATAASFSDHHHALPATPVLVPFSSASQGFGGDVKSGVSGLCGGSFTSLLSTQGPGFLALGGFGLGLGTGLEDLSFGLGRGIWPFSGVADCGGGGGGGIGGSGGAGGGPRGLGSSWQFENGDHHHHHGGHGGGLVAAAGVGDFCSWAEPAISRPGNGLK